MVHYFSKDACEETKYTIIGVHSIDNEQKMEQAKRKALTLYL